MRITRAILHNTPDELFIEKIKSHCRPGIPICISIISKSLGIKFSFLVVERLAEIETHGLEVIVCPGKKTWLMESKYGN